jgi:hypothetical protein
MPLILGTRQGYETFECLLIALKSSLELAICGIHFGETNDPTYMVFNPLYVSLFINSTFFCSSTIFFSF